MVSFVSALAGESAEEDCRCRRPTASGHAGTNLGTAWAPDDCIVCGFGASEVYAVNSWIVAQVLAFFTTAIHK